MKRPGTIYGDLREQWFRCTVCGEAEEIPRKLLNDQHALMERVDELTEDHRECASHPLDPQLAIVQRKFRKSMERELARASDGVHVRPQMRRRCSGK